MAIVWPKFGPYHIARLDAAGQLLSENGIATVGLEIAGKDAKYPWDAQAQAAGFRRMTLFAQEDYQDLVAREIASVVRSALDEVSPHAVAVNGWAFPEARAALRWCHRNGAVSILMSESKADDAPPRWAKEWVKKRIVTQFDAALVGGTPHRDYVVDLGVPRDRVFLGYDVVDNEYFQSESDACRSKAERWAHGLGLPRRYFLTCCRFVPKKNLGRLIRAYARYRGLVDTPWGLVICGDGDLAHELHSLARNVGVNDIRWPGFVQIDDLPKYYRLASAFILPSTTEQWGLVVNEAMASGLPVLVSERAGCRYDLTKDGQNGFLFDPYDVNDMADKMLAFSRLSQRDRDRMGRASREIIAHWGPERFAQGLLSAVQAALGAAETPCKGGIASAMLLKAAGSAMAMRIWRR